MSRDVRGNSKRKASQEEAMHFLQPQGWDALEVGLFSMLFSIFMLLIFPCLDLFLPSSV